MFVGRNPYILGYSRNSKVTTRWFSIVEDAFVGELVGPVEIIAHFHVV